MAAPAGLTAKAPGVAPAELVTACVTAEIDSRKKPSTKATARLDARGKIIFFIIHPEIFVYLSGGDYAITMPFANRTLHSCTYDIRNMLEYRWT